MPNPSVRASKYIKQLSRLKLNQQKSFLKDEAPDELIDELHFLIKQLVNNKNVLQRLNKKHIDKISRFKTFLRKIANSKAQTPTIRVKIAHGLKSGLFPTLRPLLPVIASTIASIVSGI